MSLSLTLAAENDLSAMHGILSICGEHMFRKYKMSHWYPFRDFAAYQKEVEQADVYAVYDEGFLVGTFYVTPHMRPWYADVTWHNADHRALYLGGLGILPITQGWGTGTWVMSQVDALTMAGNYNALRFDGVASNEGLVKYYDKLGYTQRGLLATPRGSEVMVYERLFENPA
ncbi:MAG: hypothetical protein WBC91_08480 [Phototrophicaceae bacterium]